ncbi:MAG TPA: Ig-like domain-containing protein [Candidatus Limnocylindrales bacterium]|nr:Ig-like domain-containing protein [Candidatus Limnocylindrales bacterium]
MTIRRFVAVTVAACFVLALGAVPARTTSSSIVVSQVYGGGGNTGAPLTNDYIEIFNRGTSLVDLSNWSLQYTSATGTGNFGANSALLSELGGFLAPGEYLVVKEAAGATPSGDFSADIVDPTPISMGATAGKVALVNTTAPLGCNGSSTPCSPAALASIVDLVGYGGANFFEGAGPTPAPSNTTAAFRADFGCTDTDDNSADFLIAAPAPRNRLSPAHFCNAENPPSVTSTTPTNGATGVARSANVTIDFSEPVDVSGTWYSIACGTSGSHTATQSGGPQSYTLDPDSDFAFSETCTVTVYASQVSDQDLLDPPDNMDSDYAFTFTTESPPVRIHDIQGASHTSPLAGTSVAGVAGIVTAKLGNGFYMQDPTPDADDATSEAIFVFTASSPIVNVGDDLRVSGNAAEFRPGGSSSANLTTTEITSPTITVLSSGNALPAPTVLGNGGRIPPAMVIEDDATGSVETSGAFDPAQDGIDFYESLEAMRVQLNDAVAVGPRNAFGEIPVVGDDSASAGVDTVRGGVIIRPDDFNPERIILDDTILPTPVVDLADGFTTTVVGVMDYSFGNFKLNVTAPLTPVDGGLAREVTRAPLDREIVVGTYNVENLDPGDGPAFARHADLIVNLLRSPDLLAIEEIQDNDGPANTSVTDASTTWNTLIAAIQAAGGPTYQYRQIDPVDDQDGGEPGGNIRVGFLFRTDRGLSFVDRPGGDSTTPTTVIAEPSGARLSYSPGRVDPQDPAWVATRKPLAGEFRMRGKKLFVIANHFSSKGGDQPLFGRFQPPQRSSEVARHAQAQVVNDFVDEILAADPHANVIVLGDINDFEFSQTVEILEGGVLTDLMNTLPQPERYSYVFEGNSQVLDQILVSDNLLGHFPIDYDPVHVNSEFADQASDHDPQVARLDLRGRPAPK